MIEVYWVESIGLIFGGGKISNHMFIG